MKKVLIFSIVYLPFFGGAEVAVKEITNRLTNWQFDLITLRLNSNLPKQEKIGNVNVFRVGFSKKEATVPDFVKFPLVINKFLFPFLAAFLAWRMYRRNDYQLIFSLMASQASVAASIFKILKPKVKLILNLQEGDEEAHLKRYVGGNDLLYKLLIRPWHLLVFKKADQIVAISHSLEERAKMSGARCPIAIIPNGVNTTHFSYAYPPTELNELKNKLGKGHDDIFVVTTSRLVKKNALDDVIKSLAHLPPQVKFIIIGIGPDEKLLKDLTQGLKVEDRVRFLGQIDHEDLPKYLQVSDIFIRPSLSEGLGNSFLEAMAASLPVIATPVGGIPDFLFDPEANPDQEPTGLFCQVRNPESIAAKVKLYLSDKELTGKIVSNAKKMVKEKYNWDMVAHKLVDIFRALTN